MNLSYFMIMEWVVEYLLQDDQIIIQEIFSHNHVLTCSEITLVFGTHLHNIYSSNDRISVIQISMERKTFIRLKHPFRGQILFASCKRFNRKITARSDTIAKVYNLFGAKEEGAPSRVLLPIQRNNIFSSSMLAAKAIAISIFNDKCVTSNAWAGVRDANRFCHSLSVSISTLRFTRDNCIAFQ